MGRVSNHGRNFECVAILRDAAFAAPHHEDLVLILDRIAQDPDPLDLDFANVALLHPDRVRLARVPDAGKGLKIESRLNGTVMQSDNTDNMMFPVAEMLVYVTQGMTLEPGDIIFTGTPSGVGHARKPNPIWMKPGDVCEIEIEGIGVLRNPIQDEN